MADIDDISYQIESMVKEVNEKITQGMKARAYSAANELRNSSQTILRGQRSGREYIIPGTGRMKYYKRGSKDGKHKAGTATITYRRYRASAPGEPPANRLGGFREGWQTKTESTGSGDSLSVKAMIENSVRTENGKYLLGEILEDGTGKMAPRPYKEKILADAKPRIIKIYKRPYF